MSLIKGMDDVMTHIKNQEIRIKKSEEENRRLEFATVGMSEEIKSLKENKYDKFQCAKCLGHHTGCSNPTCDSCVKELKEENEKLKNIENNDKQEMYASLEDLQEENKFYWKSMEERKELNESQRKTIQDYHTKEAKRLNEIYCINKQMESLQKKLVDLEEFKKKAEDECEASVVMEAMMTRIEQAESNQKKSEEKTEEYKSTFGLMNEMIKDKDNMIYKFLVHPSNEKRFGFGIDYLEEHVFGCYPREFIDECLNTVDDWSVYTDDDFDNFIEWEDEEEFNLFAVDYELDVRYDDVGEDLYDYRYDYIDWYMDKNKMLHKCIGLGMDDIHIVK